MATKGILIFNWEGKPIISMDLAYPFKHKPRDINQTKSTMNKYKIGDTVWTRKRGECTVLTIAKQGRKKDRPYWIRPIGSFMVYNPKAENLCQSESECKKAQFLKGKRTVTIDFSAFVEIKPDQIQPKFKVGDAVYRNGQKYIVISISGQDVFYYTIKNEGTTRYSVKESDLRYWRQTSFHTRVVHNITNKEFNADRFNTQGFDMKKVKYIGHSHGSDIFIYNADTNNATILYGYKGDDI